MIEFLFVAVILLGGSQTQIGLFSTEAECRQAVETEVAASSGSVVAISPCVKLHFQRIPPVPKT